MALSPPYFKGLCPFCGNELNIGDCAIVSGLTGKVLRKPPQGLSRLRALIQPSSLDGPEYAKEIAQRQCPHCGNLLPYNFGFVGNITIAVVGDVASGKSHYIAALVHALKEGDRYGKNSFVLVESLTPEIDRAYIRDYFAPLFKNMQIIAPTMPSSVDPNRISKPLIYELVIARASKRARHFNLILYDLAGEEYANSEKLALYYQHILNANGIIFLADPMAMFKLVRQLPAHLQPVVRVGRTLTSVFTSFMRLFERYKGVRTDSDLFTVPIVIMLSKSDLLKYVRYSNKYSDVPYHLMQRPRYDSFDLQDLEVVDHEVRNLLEEFGEGTLLRAAKAFPKVKFLATSATGYSSDSKGIYPAVEPVRCLDPLLWILWQLRIIDAA